MGLSVVGLGPGPAEWVSPAAAAALRAPGARVFARTALHPALPALLAGIPHESFDDVYARAGSLEAVHEEIAARLAAAAHTSAEVVLAVPGDGALGESALARLEQRGLTPRIVPGTPLAIGALAAARAPSALGLQAVDAGALGGAGIQLAVELSPRWPAVVTGVYSRALAGEVKLALLRVYPPDHPLTVTRHPGLADERVVPLELARLDRGRVELDHLTHVVVPPVPTSTPTGSAHGLRAIVARLRAPGIGCPWDLEQTHRSLAPFVLEEAYEVVDAIEGGQPGALADELGDLLLQVALHAEVADQEGGFDWNDVVRGLSAKLIRRHPHVFGEARVGGAADVVRTWDALKAAERAGAAAPASALDGIPASLPALKRAAELARRAARAGFDWPDRRGTLDTVREALEELLAAGGLEQRREELGDLLSSLAKLAWQDGIDPEEALRAANRKFSSRFQQLEQVARERGWGGVAGRPPAELLDAWREAKRRQPLAGSD